MKLRIELIKQSVALLLISLLVLPIVPSRGFGQTPQATAGNQAWPREVQSGSITFTVYQPQLDSWRGLDLSGRAAGEKLGIRMENEEDEARQ
jgi:hypothetical protein